MIKASIAISVTLLFFGQGGSLLLAQGSAPGVTPPANKLHEVFNAFAEKRGSKARLELNGCQSSRSDTTCYYRMPPATDIEVIANDRNAPIRTITATVASGKDSVRQMAGLAGGWAIVLIPDLAPDDQQKLMRELAENSVWDSTQSRLRFLEFDLNAAKDKTTLKVYVNER